MIFDTFKVIFLSLAPQHEQIFVQVRRFVSDPAPDGVFARLVWTDLPRLLPRRQNCLKC